MIDLHNKLPVEDRLDIEELFSRYAWALDLGDADGVVSCFTEDGLFDHLWQGENTGHDAIRQRLNELWYNRPAWWVGRQHRFNSILINKIDARTAHVRSFFTIIQLNVDYKTNFVFGLGTSDDMVVKEDDGIWRFQSKKINAWRDGSDVEWMGDQRPWEALIPNLDARAATNGSR